MKITVTSRFEHVISKIIMMVKILKLEVGTQNSNSSLFASLISSAQTTRSLILS